MISAPAFRSSTLRIGDVIFKPSTELGSGTYGLARKFTSEGGDSVVVKSPCKPFSSLVDSSAKNIMDHTEKEYQFFKSIYPKHAQFHLFESPKYINSYTYRMVTPLFKGVHMGKIPESFFSDHNNFICLIYNIISELLKVHALNIVHGDLRKKNILVDVDDPMFVVHLIDFGEAEKVGEEKEPYFNYDKYTPPELRLDIPFYLRFSPNPEKDIQEYITLMSENKVTVDTSQDGYMFAMLIQSIRPTSFNNTDAVQAAALHIINDFITSALKNTPNERPTLEPLKLCIEALDSVSDSPKLKKASHDTCDKRKLSKD